jgi:hypothetical protein
MLPAILIYRILTIRWIYLDMPISFFVLIYFLNLLFVLKAQP